MTSKLDASLFAGNQGISIKSDYDLWGTTTRKMKFRINSMNGQTGLQANELVVPINFTNMPNVKRATLVPESFSLSVNAHPALSTGAGAIAPARFWGLGGSPGNVQNGVPYSQVCLRCRELSQPNSFDNGSVGQSGVPNVIPSDHSSFQGQSNIIMSMPMLSGQQKRVATGFQQTFRNYNGNEYDCGMELANNVFQVNQLTFQLTNEYGGFYNMGSNDPTIPPLHSWSAEFSIVYEPEKTEFELN
jgi:hypothetical protein